MDGAAPYICAFAIARHSEVRVAFEQMLQYDIPGQRVGQSALRVLPFEHHTAMCLEIMMFCDFEMCVD